MEYSKLLMRNDSLTNNAHVSSFSPPQLLIYRTLNRVSALTTHRLSYRRLGHSWAMQQPPARVNSKTADKKLTLNKLVGTLSTVRSSNNIMCSGKRRKTRFCLFHSHHKLTTRLSSHLDKFLEIPTNFFEPIIPALLSAQNATIILLARRSSL